MRLVDRALFLVQVLEPGHEHQVARRDRTLLDPLPDTLGGIEAGIDAVDEKLETLIGVRQQHDASRRYDDDDRNQRTENQHQPASN